MSGFSPGPSPAMIAASKIKKAKALNRPMIEPPDQAWPIIDENAPLMSGGPRGNATIAEQNPMMSTHSPATVTSASIPQGASELDVRRSLRDKTMMRNRVINQALTTTDPGVREQLIAQRQAIENEIRPLGAALPQKMATPEGTQAGREHLRQELLRARESSGAPVPDSMDPALTAGMGVAAGNRAMTTPMANPQDELRRQQMLRLAARDTQVAGSGTDQYLTTPEMIERRRRKDAAAMASRGPEKPVNEIFPDVTPEEANQIRNRTEGVVAQRARDASGAGDVLARDATARMNARKLREGEQTLAAERQAADIAQERARGAGTDTASVRAKADLARAEGDLRTAQAEGQNSADEAERSSTSRPNMVVKDSIGRLEAMIPSIVEPGIGRIGYGGPEQRDAVVATTLGDIQKALPALTPAQKAEYANRVRPMLYQLMQDSSIFGRGDYREKYVNQLRELLTALET